MNYKIMRTYYKITIRQRYYVQDKQTCHYKSNILPYKMVKKS
ncbi:hypothetical protein NADRNF5_0920 [Nitrosopumilus adriaticus]|uniref:Uncharacterized protein n=1 Tax=Nitrosopumilus adriaticus TaxID=1580092 RepID=A0A0D5C1E5_9ARCH|nr:hypothetical protein NADRNF5_0920 [Nitrosopumilus adriaticus]